MARKRNTEAEPRLAAAAAQARQVPRTTRSKHAAKSSPETLADTEIETAPEPVETTAVVAPPSTPSHEEVAALAHSYWVARGGGGGSPEEDWLRAEAELRQGRS